MKYSELRETENCEECPLKINEICPGGFTCYGGQPIEPPCCGFDDDTDLDEWVSEYFDGQRRYEEAEDRRVRKERERQERNALAQKHRREAAWEVRAETREIKSLQKRISGNKAAMRLAESMAFAFNITNEMFRYEERVTVKNSPLLQENERCKQRIAELEQIKKAKLASLRKRRVSERSAT